MGGWLPKRIQILNEAAAVNEIIYVDINVAAAILLLAGTAGLLWLLLWGAR